MIDPAKASGLCEKIIRSLEGEPQAECFAALMAATAVQRNFMLERGMFAEVIQLEQDHQDTITALSREGRR